MTCLLCLLWWLCDACWDIGPFSATEATPDSVREVGSKRWIYEDQGF
jgi:hypothetical protein